MTTSNIDAFVSRRAALAALGAGGLVAFASPVRQAAAQATPSAADADLVELIRATERSACAPSWRPT